MQKPVLICSFLNYLTFILLDEVQNAVLGLGVLRLLIRLVDDVCYQEPDATLLKNAILVELISKGLLFLYSNFGSVICVLGSSLCCMLVQVGLANLVRVAD